MKIQWTTEKPDFKEECLLITAYKIKGKWEYSLLTIEKLTDYDGKWYFGWIDVTGNEYGSLSDLEADKYLTMPLLTEDETH